MRFGFRIMLAFPAAALAEPGYITAFSVEPGNVVFGAPLPSGRPLLMRVDGEGSCKVAFVAADTSTRPVTWSVLAERQGSLPLSASVPGFLPGRYLLSYRSDCSGGKFLQEISIKVVEAKMNNAPQAQPPFDHQLSLADHVVVVRRAADGYQLVSHLRGAAQALRWQGSGILAVDDAIWRLLGRTVATGGKALLLLRDRSAAEHLALELYPLDRQECFVHAPDDASVRQRICVAELPAMLSALSDKH